MIGTGTGTSEVKVTSQSDAPLDGHVSSGAAAVTDKSTGVKTFDEVKADMLAKAATTPVADKTVTAKVEVPALDEKAVAEAAKLASDQIAAKRAQKAQEQTAAAAKLATDIAAAVADGRMLEAAKLAGIDLDKVNAEAIAAAAQTPEQREIAELKARLDALTAKPVAADPLVTGREAAADEIAKDTAKYPTIAADRAVILAALVEAEATYNTVATEQKRALTKEEADGIISAALAKAEATALAKVPTKHTEHSQEQEKTREAGRRTSPSLPTKPLSFDEAKAAFIHKR